MSMPWIKIATAITTDAKVHHVAQRCKVRDAEAVGLIVGVLTTLPQLAPDGNLADVGDATVERVAMWEGKRGVFAEAFRAVWCADGVVSSWERWNGAAVREAAKRAKRAKEWRDENAERTHSECIQNTEQTPNEQPKRKKEKKTTAFLETQEEGGIPSTPAEVKQWVAPFAHEPLDRLFQSVPDVPSWVGLFRGYAAGLMTGRPTSAGRLAVAVQEFVARGKHLEDGGPSVRLFKGFVERAQEPANAPKRAPTDAEWKAEQLRDLRDANEKRVRLGFEEKPLPAWAPKVDAMFPDGRTFPAGVAA